MMKFLKSRKGVSGVISGIFVILICFLALGALFIFAISHDRYNQVVNERNTLDWEIENENFQIIAGQRNSDGTLNLTLFNYGGVAAHLVDMWITSRNQSGNYQKLYGVDYWLNPGEPITELGDENMTELPSGIAVSGIILPQPVDPTINYTIMLVSERGNKATYLIRYVPPLECPEGVGQPVPLIISWQQGSFEFKSMAIDSWTPAWVKPGQSASQHQIYRINLTNVSGNNIVLNESSHLRQEADDTADTEAVWWISDLSTDPFDQKPTPFNINNPQTINDGESQYVYFAATSELGESWNGDPTSSHYYTVFIHVFFHFEGEDVYYGHTISVMGQKLY